VRVRSIDTPMDDQGLLLVAERVVFFVTRVGDCGKKIRIAESTANVFGRAGVLPIVAAD
jgi:hypothetical protein